MASNEEIKSAAEYVRKYDIDKKYDLKKQFVCMSDKCDQVLSTNKDNKPTKKQKCGHDFDPSKGSCFTITLPIEKQVRLCLENGSLRFPPKPYDGTTRGDIQTGDCYREKMETWSRTAANNKRWITTQLNTDGARAWKSSKFGVWLLMGLLNEMPYQSRRKNVILMAIWYGNKKPPREPFLNTSIAELKYLGKVGFEFEGVQYFVKPLVLTTDTMARSIFLFCTQCSGLCGCDFCLHPGIVFSSHYLFMF